MNNKDIFLMTTAVMAVWSKSSMKKSYGIAIANKDKELIKVSTYFKSSFQSEIDFILNIFSTNFNYSDTFIYTTFKPSENFILAAKIKKVTNLFWLEDPRKHNNDLCEEQFAKPFICNFGVVIDLLAQYIDII